MKTFFTGLRNLVISGLVLLPMIVILVIIAKAWKAMTSIGAKVAGIFGISSIVGFKGSHIFTGRLMLALYLLCGLLMRFSFVAAFSKAVERWMSKYIPAMTLTKPSQKKSSKTRHGSFHMPVHWSDSKSASCRHMLSSKILMAIT
jgi:hypothetical protein